VLIADDHAMFRQGVWEMLSTHERIEVLGEAENGRQAARGREHPRHERVHVVERQRQEHPVVIGDQGGSEQRIELDTKSK
jgi:DNA-binding NarL/FixJ family response regulator